MEALSSGIIWFRFHLPQANRKKSSHGSSVTSIAAIKEAAIWSEKERY